VLSWRAWVISTFVADERLRCLWWNTSNETDVQSHFNAQMLFCVFATCRNHWHGTHVAFCNLWKEHGLYSSKFNVFLFVSAQWWVFRKSYEMSTPLWKPTSGDASSRESRGVTRGERRAHFPGAESLRGALKSPNNVTSSFFNTVHLLPEELRFWTCGRQTCFLTRVPFNLVTPLRERTTF